MPIRKTDVHPKPRRAPATLAQLVAREHARLGRLEREHRKLTRQLARSRMRYSVLMRLSADDARRFAGDAPAPLSSKERRILASKKASNADLPY